MSDPDPPFRKPNLVDLQADGILWAINRTVFHPRGFALGLVIGDAGQPIALDLLGDGLEPWHYACDAEAMGDQAARSVDEADLLARFERCLDRARAQ